MTTTIALTGHRSDFLGVKCVHLYPRFIIYISNLSKVHMHLAWQL